MLGNSQTEILKTLLYAQEAVNIDAMSQHLGISRNATYQHIKTLERDGLIAGHKIARTKGRPSQTYQLTRAGRATFTQSYALVATSLIDALKKKMTEAELKDLLEDLGGSLAAGVNEDLTSMPLPERISRIADLMETLGYETELEGDETASKAPPEIVAHNCVFHDVAEEHPEVCSMDLALLDSLSGCEVEHRECIVRGENKCRFAFKEKN
ncbi:HTH domain-containing protein [uncultured Ruegeria sp.]|uniref:helix-turn-helix transcriptional regulator n=1 Tax=uncultured Ruegeria sp. TaxID=259304 RepID=UPI002605BA95|nr:HTH domain-containing protein [uncultured Ruegeria sp.]